jgi:SAM-dependent methyltransferase
MPQILDVCCGTKAFYFDKNDDRVVFNDLVPREVTLSDRKIIVSPDTSYDFTDLPYENEAFYGVVFDPPHLLHVGKGSYLREKYGKLPKDWRPFIKSGFDECMRVLKPNGFLAFKWNEEQVPTKEILKTIGVDPIFGDRRSKTRWMFFVKGGKNDR